MRETDQRPGAAATAADETQTRARRRHRHLEPPVFHDATGRRRRFVTLLGVTAAVLTATWLCAMVVGASGFSTLPSLRRVLAVHRARGWTHVRHVVAASQSVSRATLVRSARAATPRHPLAVRADRRNLVVDLQ